MKKILVFPCSMPRSLEMSARHLEAGNAVVGASSLQYDPNSRLWPTWVHLPYITDPEFESVFLGVLEDLGIDGVISPHHVVWNHLSELLTRLGREELLRNRAPIDEEMDPYRTALAKADSLLAGELRLDTPMAIQPPLSRIDAAALFHHLSSIPGQSDENKLYGVYAAARSCPPGDCVEIGSLWGKSAFMLGFLTDRYGLGNTLCVDPWSSTHILQTDASEVVDRTSATFDTQEAFRVFLINLRPYLRRHLNYLRLPSIEAASRYGEQRLVETPEFGAVPYQSKIAMLHIDGNHDFEAVREDLRAWLPHLVDFGWLLLDDYLWPFGDGPRRAIEEILADQSDRVCCAFVSGGTLFLQLRSE